MSLSPVKMCGLGLSLAILSACNGPAGMETETSKNGVTAELIAEVDGCRVWRIDPGGTSHKVYMSRCFDGAATTQQAVSCGKNCTRPQFNLGAKSTGGKDAQ